MDREEAREKILEKFQEMVPVFGLKRLTVDMLAKKCGMSKKTIYEHFKDKEEIIRCSTDFILGGVRDHVLELDEQVDDPLEKLNLLFDLSFSIASDIPEIVLHDIKQYYPEIQNEMDAMVAEVSRISEKSIYRGIELGLFKDIKPGFVITFITGAARAVLNTDCLLENNMTAEEAMAGFRELVLSGLLRTELFQQTEA